MFHDFCFNMADDVSAVVVLVEYRLARSIDCQWRMTMPCRPCIGHWIKTHPDGWLTHYADYSKCYLMGSSARGNIAYQAGLRAAEEVDHLEPLKIKGLIFVQPLFGGRQRTGSEVRLMNDWQLPLCVTELLWKLSLPVGADRDHEYCNRTAGDGWEKVEKIRRRMWRVLVTGCGVDPLVDRQKEVVKMEERKVKVVGHFTEGECYGIQDRDFLKAKELYALVKNFMSSFGLNVNSKRCRFHITFCAVLFQFSC